MHSKVFNLRPLSLSLGSLRKGNVRLIKWR